MSNYSSKIITKADRSVRQSHKYIQKRNLKVLGALRKHLLFTLTIYIAPKTSRI